MIVQRTAYSKMSSIPPKAMRDIRMKVNSMAVRCEIFIHPNREDLSSGTIM